jgi:hypothetical protein
MQTENIELQAAANSGNANVDAKNQMVDIQKRQILHYQN